MGEDMLQVARQVLQDNLGLRAGEQLLVIEDETTLKIGEALFAAGAQLGARALLLRIQPLGRSGAEPPEAVARAMGAADVVIAATAHSLTHTQAKKAACAAGVRVATMPGITEEMFFAGPITADYNRVAALTRRIADLLSSAEEATLEKDGQRLRLSLRGRKGIASTGVYRERGASGNLPSGEAYIAPVEGSAEGVVIVDGSFAGLGRPAAPLKLTFTRGVLTAVEGPDGGRLLNLLGDDPQARNLAELGIGTNDKARITGVILEDEKAYGTVHVALGSNDTFGGRVAAGIHVDGVIKAPDLYIDGRKVLSGGRILLD